MRRAYTHEDAAMKNSQKTNHHNLVRRCGTGFWPLLLNAILLSVLALPAALTAGTTAMPPDGNSRLLVLDTLQQNGATRVLYLSYPDRGDAASGKACAVEAYEVTLQPDLANASHVHAASKLCGALGTQGRLMADGSVLILTGKQLLRWRGGQLESGTELSAIDSIARLKPGAADPAQKYSIGVRGDLLGAVPVAGQGRTADLGVSIFALSPEGELLWNRELRESGKRLSLAGIWAGANGGALLYVESMPSNGSSMNIIRQLLPISAVGEVLQAVNISEDQQFDLQQITELGQADMARLGEIMQSSYLESVPKLAVSPAADGGFAVLFDRSSEPAERQGQFLYRIRPDGTASPALDLTDQISGHGLENWTTFRVENNQLILLGEVSARQAGLQARRTHYPQNAVSWLRLEGGEPLTRLIPLDSSHLEAVMNAGDEQLQTIKNRPGAEPAMLSKLGSLPLVVGIGYLQGREVLRFDVAAEGLLAWDEVYQQQQQKLAKQALRQQRKQQTAASQQQIKADMAAAAGMRPEAYDALSKDEQMAALIRSGNFEAAMAAAQQQFAGALAQQAEMPGGTSQAMDPQTAAAIAQAMAQLQGGSANPVSTPTAPQGQSGAATGHQPESVGQRPVDALTLGVNQRGFIEFDHPQGEALTLLVVEVGAGQSEGHELLRKDYADGVIYEHVDFARFALPLSTIRVRYLDASGVLLKELTPVVGR